jgi:hypothetical protein
MIMYRCTICKAMVAETHTIQLPIHNGRHEACVECIGELKYQHVSYIYGSVMNNGRNRTGEVLAR